MDTPELTIEILSPIAALTSKAIKAPEKNRILLTEALAAYGDELANKILRHGDDLTKFITEI